MLDIDIHGNISYSVGDTLSLIVEPDDGESFTSGDTLDFIIKKEGASENLISKTIELSDGKFSVSLASDEIALLTVGQYVYKIRYISGEDKVTQVSGVFEVKWGA